MKFSKIFLLILIINFNSLPQTENTEIKNKEEHYLKSYVKFGMGKLNDYLNFGGGLFFPLTNKFMLGLRGNVNSEVGIFKTPSEALLDIDLSVKYIPIIWDNFIAMANIGVGYAIIKKRGAFIKRQLIGFVEEYEEEKYNSISGLAEIEFGYFLTKFLGISVSGYSVFTNKKSINTYQISLFFYGLK